MSGIDVHRKCANRVLHKKNAQVTGAIVHAHQDRGVQTKLLTNFSQSNELSSLVDSVLAEAGIEPRYVGRYKLMHSKFIVTEKYLVLGSLNLSTRGRRSNVEHMLVVGVGALHNVFKEIFEAIYQETQTKEQIQKTPVVNRAQVQNDREVAILATLRTRPSTPPAKKKRRSTVQEREEALDRAALIARRHNARQARAARAERGRG